LLVQKLCIERAEPNAPGSPGTLDGQSDDELDISSLATSISSTESFFDDLKTTPPSSISSSEKLRHKRQGRHLYRNMEARDQAMQLNGDLGDTKTLSMRCRNQYDGNVARSNSVQVNGNISDPAFMATLLAR
jgi:hypothetical protein